jgi:PBSX family phage portal protein
MSGWWLDEDGQYRITGVRAGNKHSTSTVSSDPFTSKWSEIKKDLTGLHPNFKKRAGRIEKRDGTAAIQYDQSYITAYGMFDVITPPYNLDELARYYEVSFANHAAVDTKVANIVGLGYHWELSPDAVSKIDSKETEKQRAAARKKVERLKVWLDQAFDDMNDTDTFIATMEKVVTDLESTGNGYLEIGRKANGQIGYIGHVPALTIRVRRKRDGFCQIVGRDVVFFRNFQEDTPNPLTTDPNPNEIIHFKLYSPLNTYYGVPDAIAAGQAIVGDQYANQYNIDYFQNKAVPRYIVTVKGAHLDQESEEKLFRFLQTDLKGSNHRTLYIPLPPDNEQTKVEFKMEAIEAGVQEGSFEKYHKQTRNDILTAHQVPLSKIGMADSGSAEALASDRTFKEQVARPKQRQIEKKLNHIVKEFTDVLSLKLNELTLTDEMAQSQIDEKYLRSQVLTPNEVRDTLGKPPIPGGDKVIELSPRQAADAKNQSQQSDQRARDRANNASDSPTTVSGRNPKGQGSK